MFRLHVQSVAAILVLVSNSVLAGVDLTIAEDVAGMEVVLATIAKIEASHVFDSDKRLLRRIAYVETADGESPQASVENGGGVWNVGKDHFELTKRDATLADKRGEIAAAFPEIADWELVEWEDLNKPLWSALAARLVILLAKVNNMSDIPAPSDVSGQATFWNSFYNSNGNAAMFQTAVETLIASDIKFDLAFVLDGSGSVGAANFDKVRNFVHGFVDELEIGVNETRVSVIRYSTVAETVFHLKEYTNKSALLEGVSNIPYNGGYTNTADGLCLLLEEGYTEENGARLSSDDVFRTAIVMTDGQSNRNSIRCGFTTFEATEAVHNASHPILVFAVGVTSGVNEEELRAIATTEEYITLLTYFNPYAFKETSDEQTYKICTKGTIPKDVGDQLYGRLKQRGKIRYEFEMPSEGLTFNLCVSEGEVELHSSFRLPNPNSALYDRRCEAHVINKVMCSDVLIPPDANSANSKVYASLEGLGELMNHYMLQALVGDQTVSGGDIYDMVHAIGGEHNGSIGQGAIEHYEFPPVPVEGVTMELCIDHGYIHIYGSFSVRNPNTTVHDFMYEVSNGSDNCVEFFLSPKDFTDATDAAFTLHVSLEGIQDHNKFTITTSPGDTTVIGNDDPDKKDASDDLGVTVVVIPAVVAGLVCNLLISLIICVLVARACKKRQSRVGVEASEPQIAAQSKKNSAYFYAHQPTE